MEFVPGNVARVACGSRTYGLKPVVPLPRGFWELLWIFEGSAHPYSMEREVPRAPAPSLYISHPDSPHGWTDESAARSEIHVLHFRSVPAEMLAAVRPAGMQAIPLRKSEVRRHRRLLDEAGERHAAKDPSWRIRFDQILLEVTLLLMERVGPAATAEGPVDRVKAALQWYEENVTENPSTDDVARVIGVTRGHLRRMFLEAGLNAPKTEFSRLKMAVAQRCLIAGWKLDRIAAYLGYSESGALSRSFLSVCGRSPRRWLAECPERVRARDLT